MSDSMIERVAIAIATSHLNDPPDPVCVFDFYALTGDVAEKYYAMARAAIEAMRPYVVFKDGEDDAHE